MSLPIIAICIPEKVVTRSAKALISLCFHIYIYITPNKVDWVWKYCSIVDLTVFSSVPSYVFRGIQIASWILDTVKEVWSLFFSLEAKLAKLNRLLIRSSNWRVSFDGMKLSTIKLCLNKSAINWRSFWSVYFPWIAFTYFRYTRVPLTQGFRHIVYMNPIYLCRFHTDNEIRVQL